MLKRPRQTALSAKPCKTARIQEQEYKTRHELTPEEVKYVFLDGQYANNEFKKIIHLSDIHVPSNLHLGRHAEYTKVFEKLYLQIAEIISANDPNTILIVITGDIVHAKIDIQNEAINMTRNFLATLGNLAPTIVIIGNHDFIENNKSRKDSLSVLVDRLPNVYGLKYSGVYELGNVLFSFSSLFDEMWVPHASIANPKNLPIYKLYHGTVYSSVNCNGYANTKPNAGGHDYVMTSKFSGYISALLGHVHKVQQIVGPTKIFYAGSLIQQNIGEDIAGHGFLVWDITHPDQDPQFFSVYNEYVFFKVLIADGQIINMDELMRYKDRNLYLKCKCTNTSVQEYDAISLYLKGEFKVETMSLSSPLQPSFKCVSAANKKRCHESLAENEQRLIRQFAQKELLDSIISLHHDIASCVEVKKGECKSLTDVDSEGQWTIKSVTFQNMFSYGDDCENVVDFLNGVYNLSSGNATGKSSLCNVILFALFGCVSENLAKCEDISFTGKKNAHVKLVFEYNTQDFTIERSTTNGGDKFDLKFYTGSVDLAGKSKTTTQKIIENYVGTIGAFTTHNMLSTRFVTLIQMTPTDRLKAFHHLAKTDKYEKYMDEAKKRSSVIKFQLKSMDGQLLALRAGVSSYESDSKDDDTSVETKLKTMAEEIKSFSIQKQEMLEQKNTLIEKRAVLSHEMEKYPQVLNPSIIKKEYVASVQSRYDELLLKNPDIVKTLEHHNEHTLSERITTLRERHKLEKQITSHDLIRRLAKLRQQLAEITDKQATSNETPVNLKKRQHQLEIQIAAAEIHMPLHSKASIEEKLKDLENDVNVEKVSDVQQLQKKRTQLSYDLSKMQQLQTAPCSSNRMETTKTLEELMKESQECENRLIITKEPIDEVYEKNLQTQCTHKSQCEIVKDILSNLEFNSLRQAVISLAACTVIENFVNDVQSGNLVVAASSQIELDKIKDTRKRNEAKEKNRKEDLMLLDSLKNQVAWRLHTNEENIRAQLEIVTKCICYHELKAEFKLMQQLEDDKMNLKNITDALLWHSTTAIIQQTEEAIEAVNQISTYQQSLKAIELQKEIQYSKKSELIEKQKTQQQLLNSQLESYEQNLCKLNIKITQLTEEHSILKQKTQVPKEKRIAIQKLEMEHKSLSAQLDILLEYERLFIKTMIPFKLLEQTLQTFNLNVNAIFAQNTKYSFSFEQDAREKLVFVVTRKQSKSKLEPQRLSGFESVVLILAINHAALSIASSQSCGFLIVDESLDCLDTRKFTDMLPMIIDVMKTYYRTILLISHRDVPSATIDRQLKITFDEKKESSYICT